jgi:CheY-like chemotaxis protein
MTRAADVLMVEDNEDDIAVALWALKKHNLSERVEVVRDGQQALDQMSARPPGQTKVILLDLKMPRVDGREVLRRLRADERTRTVPVVVISSSRQIDDIAECYRLGANSYVCKRYSTARAGEYLIDVVQYWVGLNRIPESSPQDPE